MPTICGIGHHRAYLEAGAHLAVQQEVHAVDRDVGHGLTAVKEGVGDVGVPPVPGLVPALKGEAVGFLGQGVVGGAQGVIGAHLVGKLEFHRPLQRQNGVLPQKVFLLSLPFFFVHKEERKNQ